MEETKRTSNYYPSKSSFISLKDIPPLDPSSIPRTTTSVKPESRMMTDYGAKQRWEVKNERKSNEAEEGEEEYGNSCLSTIQIDPNSTLSREITQERKLVPEPEEELVCKCHTRPRVEEDGPKLGSAKSQLHEICVARHWKPPVYECCNDEGPCHNRMYTFKVVIEIRESTSTTFLECFGAPRSKKKTAAEHAAEGALWYLKQFAHSLRTDKDVEPNQTKP